MRANKVDYAEMSQSTDQKHTIHRVTSADLAAFGAVRVCPSPEELHDVRAVKLKAQKAEQKAARAARKADPNYVSKAKLGKKVIEAAIYSHDDAVDFYLESSAVIIKRAKAWVYLNPSFDVDAQDICQAAESGFYDALIGKSRFVVPAGADKKGQLNAYLSWMFGRGKGEMATLALTMDNTRKSTYTDEYGEKTTIYLKARNESAMSVQDEDGNEVDFLSTIEARDQHKDAIAAQAAEESAIVLDIVLERFIARSPALSPEAIREAFESWMSDEDGSIKNHVGFAKKINNYNYVRENHDNAKKLRSIMEDVLAERAQETLEKEAAAEAAIAAYSAKKAAELAKRAYIPAALKAYLFNEATSAAPVAKFTIAEAVKLGKIANAIDTEYDGKNRDRLAAYKIHRAEMAGKGIKLPAADINAYNALEAQRAEAKLEARAAAIARIMEARAVAAGEVVEVVEAQAEVAETMMYVAAPVDTIAEQVIVAAPVALVAVAAPVAVATFEVFDEAAFAAEYNIPLYVVDFVGKQMGLTDRVAIANLMLSSVAAVRADRATHTVEAGQSRKVIPFRPRSKKPAGHPDQLGLGLNSASDSACGDATFESGGCVSGVGSSGMEANSRSAGSASAGGNVAPSRASAASAGTLPARQGNVIPIRPPDAGSGSGSHSPGIGLGSAFDQSNGNEWREVAYG